ncbi:MAG: indolepyruvate oxidoreductase subunit beta [Candidatus Bathyarchaeia archaeon]|nr:indolepyruvate oxidoreductase subunit beta [Candidatus Bathyarchaeota archaeon]
MANVVLSGVGGQGVLTLAALIGSAAIFDGYEVRMSEVHGMAQRGGQVVCHVKYGAKVYSPLVMEGTADLIVALEASEALRVAHYLKARGAIIINNLELPPPLAVIKGVKYPNLKTIVEELSKITGKVYVVNAQEIAKTVGSLNVVNTIMLGASWATGELDVSENSLIKAIVSRFGEKWKDINVKAFKEGVKAVSKG